MTRENFARIYCKAAVDVKKNFKVKSRQKEEIAMMGRMFGGKSAQSVKDAEAPRASWQLLTLSLSRHTEPRLPKREPGTVFTRPADLPASLANERDANQISWAGLQFGVLVGAN
jgi:hypothetical protein